MSGSKWFRRLAALLAAGGIALGAHMLGDIVFGPPGATKNAGMADTGPAALPGRAKAETVDAVSPFLASADIAHGERLAAVCTSCHSFNKDGASRVGPNLWNVVGAPRARKGGYRYSDALSSSRGNWDYEALNQFLYKPQQYMPGTKMGFAGLRRVQDRADVIAWLRTQSDGPAPLP